MSAQRAPSLLQSAASDLPAEAVERVQLSAGRVLASPASESSFAYLPLTAVCSVLVATADVSLVEIILVGYEGVVPLVSASGGMPALEHIVVLVSGEALRVPTARLQEFAGESRIAREALDRFAYAMVLQAGVNSVCHRMHRMEQRFAHWLLHIHDRCGSDEFGLTHATIASRMGVRRSSVTVTAKALRARGAIDYSRGRIRVTDRARLHGASCGCYDTLREAYETLGIYARPSGPQSLGQFPQRLDTAHRGA